MRIVQITPGSGDNFYCENCLRDEAMLRALRKLGHDAVMAPLYLPSQFMETGAAQAGPIFFGGINVYLQQKWGWFRRTPRWLDKVFDSRRLLRWAGRLSGMTNAHDLGATMLSMLEGEHGRQVKELERLVDWLAEERPDVVILSNALLLGLARRIKERLGGPIVCLLQDEDEFVDGLIEPYRSEAWRLLRERAVEVDRFVAVSRYYGELMRGRLGLRPAQVEVVYPGLAVEKYGLAERPERPTVGFLSRWCAGKGLDRLVEAFVVLKRREGLSEVRLRIAGGHNPEDRGFVEGVRQQLRKAGVGGDVEFIDGFGWEVRHEFLRSLSVLSVPARRGEAWGMYAVEAWACGVPVVQPQVGVFEELVELTGGGVLVGAQADAGELADALEQMLKRPGEAETMGRRARRMVREHLDVKQAAARLVEVYGRLAQTRQR